MQYPLISHLSSPAALRLTNKIISLFVSLIAQPAPSNLEKGRASELQPKPSQAQLGLFPPESQCSLEEPPVDEIPTSQYYPQSSTESLSSSPGIDMKQGVVSPAKAQQELSPNHVSQSSLHPEVQVLDFQERSSIIPSLGTSSEMGDRPVTTQPGPLELNHPLAPENRQGERSRVQPASLDGQNLEDGPRPKVVEPEREGRDGQLEKNSLLGTGNRRKWCYRCYPCPCR